MEAHCRLKTDGACWPSTASMNAAGHTRKGEKDTSSSSSRIGPQPTVGESTGDVLGILGRALTMSLDGAEMNLLPASTPGTFLAFSSDSSGTTWPSIFKRSVHLPSYKTPSHLVCNLWGATRSRLCSKSSSSSGNGAEHHRTVGRKSAGERKNPAERPSTSWERTNTDSDVQLRGVMGIYSNKRCDNLMVPMPLTESEKEIDGKRTKTLLSFFSAEFSTATVAVLVTEMQGKRACSGVVSRWPNPEEPGDDLLQPPSSGRWQGKLKDYFVRYAEAPLPRGRCDGWELLGEEQAGEENLPAVRGSAEGRGNRR